MCRHFCNVEPFQSTKCQHVKLRKLRISLHQGAEALESCPKNPSNSGDQETKGGAPSYCPRWCFHPDWSLHVALSRDCGSWGWRKWLDQSREGGKDCNSGCWEMVMLRNSDIQRYPCLCVIKSRLFNHDLPSALVLLVSQALRKIQIKYALFWNCCAESTCLEQDWLLQPQ